MKKKVSLFHFGGDLTKHFRLVGNLIPFAVECIVLSSISCYYKFLSEEVSIFPMKDSLITC